MERQIITSSQVQQPRLVTLRELRDKLLPYTYGWKWAEDAIVDLWKLGAPVPVAPGEPERRILLPKQFAKWWGELQARMGYDMQGANAYDRIAASMRASAGTTSRRR